MRSAGGGDANLLVKPPSLMLHKTLWRDVKFVSNPLGTSANQKTRIDRGRERTHKSSEVPPCTEGHQTSSGACLTSFERMDIIDVMFGRIIKFLMEMRVYRKLFFEIICLT